MFGRIQRITKRDVKDAFDNLPSGLCYFDSRGVPVLCNRTMLRLYYEMTGRDLLFLPDMLSELQKRGGKDGSCTIEICGEVWSFSRQELMSEGELYTEVTAFSVTELHEKEELLSEMNEAQRQTIASLERIQDNIVRITREEELLAMKMHLHNEFGYNLQAIRRFYERGCLPEEKEAFLRAEKEILRKLRGEIGNDDSTDPLEELWRLAENLDMKIEISGPLPKEEKAKRLLTEALRECLTNTIRHAEGDTVYLHLTEEREGDILLRTAVFTNNGKAPQGEIREGGGLSSLRTRVEREGGILVIRSRPEFSLRLTMEEKGER